MGPAVSGFAEVGPALHGLRNVWSTMSAAGAGRPAKRARLEADKRRDALAEVEDTSSLSLALPRHALPFEPIISTSTLCFYIIPLTH